LPGVVSRPPGSRSGHGFLPWPVALERLAEMGLGVGGYGHGGLLCVVVGVIGGLTTEFDGFMIEADSGSLGEGVLAERRERLKVGLSLPSVEDWMGGRSASAADLLALARLAEDLGFDSVWVPDHFTFEGIDEAPHGVWEAWSLLAAIATATNRVEIRPLVASTGFRSPALLAQTAATVDEISGGRLVLGLGCGWQERDYAMMGLPFDHPVGRFEEAVQVVIALLRDGHVDFAGRWYTIRNAELPLRGPRTSALPLMIAAAGPRMLRLAARYADRWNAANVEAPEEATPPGIMGTFQAACATEGRDPATLDRSVAIAVDLLNATPAPWAADFRHAYWRPLTGSTEAIADHIRSLSALGFDEVQVYLEPSTPAGVEAFGAVLTVLDESPRHSE
jgi:alkanesulfonate monooxygenase SsuD/methylene tetrahydromethanopterin reductase-like flavin-dependent oxidoreductase (luciferase family)